MTTPCDRGRYSPMRQDAQFFRLVLSKLWFGYGCWNRSHLSELRRFLCPFYSAGVVFAELFSVAVQTSS